MSDTLMDFDEAVRRYDPVLGLEVHVELGTATKMFDAAPNVFGAQPNTMVTPTSVGLPGALPVVNARGVEYAIRIGLALGCEIAQSCRFARKNYFYPDLAKDFQTSQSDEPIAYDGALEIEMEDGSFFTIPIERAHMEEDAGKNTHIGGADGRIEGASHSLVDYNRAGVPLVEIVTRPIEGAGARAPQVAAAYVRTLRDIFRRQRLAARVARRAAGHPHRDQERQHLPWDRAGRPLRDPASGRHPGRRGRGASGDPPRPGRRHHSRRSRQVRRRRLPLLPRAGPRAGGAQP